MIGSLAMRPARSRRAQVRRTTIASRHRSARPAGPRHARRRRSILSFRLGEAPRLFVLSAGMLAAAFLTALLYLRFATSIAATGYDVHALEQRRDELRRENQLLQLQVERLDAPARIEAEARRLGLVKTNQTLFLTAGSRLTLR